jgi:hypothetical protein
MSKILLDYVFPITVITPTPQASTAFLRQVGFLAKPKEGVDPNQVQLVTSISGLSVYLEGDSLAEAQQLFSGGMNRVYVVLSDVLDVEDLLTANQNLFYTLLISSDFDIEGRLAQGEIEITDFANLIDTNPDTIQVAGVNFVAQAGAATPGDATFQAASSLAATATSLALQINEHEDASELVTAIAEGAKVLLYANQPGEDGNAITLTYTDGEPTTIGATVSGDGTLEGGEDAKPSLTFPGVIGASSTDRDVLDAFAVIEKRCAFHTTLANGARNMCYAFGRFLSNPVNWLNQQYITMPMNDNVTELGAANSFFDDKISFVINDGEFGNRLALFAAGGKAITAPYITKNLEIDLQSRALQYISGNQPDYTIKEASLLETRLQEDVINAYITRRWITEGVIDVRLFQDNFVASGEINISEPKAMWRVFSEMRQTL